MYRDVRMHVCISVLRSVSLSTRWTVRKCQAMIGLRAKQATRGRGEFENDFSERYLRTHFTNSEDAATPPTLPHPHSSTPHSFTPPLLIHTQHHRFPHHTDYVTAIWHFHVTYFRLGPEDHVYAFNPPPGPSMIVFIIAFKVTRERTTDLTQCRSLCWHIVQYVYTSFTIWPFKANVFNRDKQRGWNWQLESI